MPYPYSYPSTSSPSFLPPTSAGTFGHLKPAPAVKRIDFPVRPHLLKYLQVHLKLTTQGEQPLKFSDYVLSSSGRWGLALTQLLRKPAKSARHEGSIDDCTVQLGVDLRNFKYPYYDLLMGKLSPWVVFQYNEFVDDYFRSELYWWVGQHRERRATIKDAIRSFMAFYDVNEDDIAYETLRKDVQRNADLPPLKKKKSGAKSNDFSMNLSQKTGVLSRKKGEVSHKMGVMSHKATFAAVRQELAKLPLPLFETEFFYRQSA